MDIDYETFRRTHPERRANFAGFEWTAGAVN